MIQKVLPFQTGTSSGLRKAIYQRNLQQAPRFAHRPSEPDEKTPGKKSSKFPIVYSLVEGTAIIGAIYGVMELTERYHEFFEVNPSYKLLVGAAMFGLHQLSHVALFAYGYKVGKRSEKRQTEQEKPPADTKEDANPSLPSDTK